MKIYECVLKLTDQIGLGSGYGGSLNQLLIVRGLIHWLAAGRAVICDCLSAAAAALILLR